VDHGVHQDAAAPDVRDAEREALSVAEEPGSEVVPAYGVVLSEIGDAQGDLEFAAMRPQAATGGDVGAAALGRLGRTGGSNSRK
jgi:hypothetical protein